MLLILNVGESTPWFDQRLEDWSPQQRIPGYEDKTRPIYLIADQNRTVHAFTSQWVGEDDLKKAIVYNQWTLDQGWTPPVDILLSPIKNEARLLGAFLDHTGIIHLIFFGGDNTQANIYYAKAPAANANKVFAWSTPLLIGVSALDPENGAIIGDDKGNIMIIYSGINYGNGLYVVYSEDFGDTWSDPEPIFLAGDDQLFPFDTKVYLGQSGKLHTVWSNYDVSGNGVSVYYANYNFTQKQWSVPYQLISGQSGLPSVIEYDGGVIAIYNDYKTNAFWMRKSSDNGKTWSNPRRIAPDHIGRNGAVSLVVDSDNVLHLLFGERIPGGPDIHGVWHITFEKDQLSPVEAVVSGPTVIDKIGDKGFDPVDVQAVISQGNTLLVTWRTDPGNSYNGVWYSYLTLNTPELPLKPLPSPSIMSVASIKPTVFSATATPTSSPELLLTESEDFPRTSDTNSSTLMGFNTQLAVGLIPAVLLIFAATIYMMFRSNRP